MCEHSREFFMLTSRMIVSVFVLFVLAHDRDYAIPLVPEIRLQQRTQRASNRQTNDFGRTFRMLYTICIPFVLSLFVSLILFI